MIKVIICKLTVCECGLKAKILGDSEYSESDKIVRPPLIVKFNFSFLLSDVEEYIQFLVNSPRV